MRALVVEAFGAPPAIREVPAPACPADGIVLEVHATGLCRSDWHGWAGHDPDIVLPHVPGHEFAGVVAEVGPLVHHVAVGARVTVPFVCACGRCPTCRRGAGQVCEDQYQPGFTGWGSFASHVAIPRADGNVIALPDELAFDVAAALGCRFATAYRAVTAHARVGPDDRVAVFGCGGVGLSAVMIAAARGAHVIAVDVSDAALARAVELGAAATAIDGPVDVTIDALGSPDVLRTALGCLRPRGRHAQVGLLVEGDPLVPMATVLARELELYGSHGMPAHDYPAMLAEIASGALQPQRLIAGHTDLAGLAAALPVMAERPPRGVLVADPRR